MKFRSGASDICAIVLLLSICTNGFNLIGQTDIRGVEIKSMNHPNKKLLASFCLFRC